MGSLVDPVGPHSPATYWRRRAVLLAVLVVLSFLVLRSLSGDDGSRAPRADPGPTTSPTTPAPAPATHPPVPPTPTTSVKRTAIRDCADAAVRVTAGTDARVYAAGSSPRLSVSVRNVGEVVCRRNVGQNALELVVVSGRDPIWSSDDCAPGGEPDPQLLRPGKPVGVSLSWSRSRSRPGCARGLPAARAGTYVLTARAGDLQSPKTVFTLR